MTNKRRDGNEDNISAHAVQLELRPPTPNPDDHAPAPTPNLFQAGSLSSQSVQGGSSSQPNEHLHPVLPSHSTSPSQDTSSDKLSALPSSTPPWKPYRHLYSPTPSRASPSGRRGSDTSSIPFPGHESPNSSSSVSDRLKAHLWLDTNQRRATSQGSIGLDHHRVSPTGTDHHSLPILHTGQSSSAPHVSYESDPLKASPPLRPSVLFGHPEPQKGGDSDNERRGRTRSMSHSHRATSPFRGFLPSRHHQHQHRHHRHEEPFVPINPFKFKTQTYLPCFSGTAEHTASTCSSDTVSNFQCDDVLPVASIKSFFTNGKLFFADTLPRQLYLNLLLRLPAMYFSRVARIFEDAEVSKPDIDKMIAASGGKGFHLIPSGSEIAIAYHGSASSPPVRPGDLTPSEGDHNGGSGLPSRPPPTPVPRASTPLPSPDEWTPQVVSPALIRFKHSWEVFIDSLLREWKTLNVVSALLLSAILTLFQIPSAASDPITRTAASLSLICAMMSLSYGCMYILRFGTMRSMVRASRWAEKARETKTSIWWNVWVFLAMPVVWISWSMILFVISVLSFFWRTGSTDDPEERTPLSPHAALGPRITLTCVFGLGMIYFVLIVKTLTESYGQPRNWKPNQPAADPPAGGQDTPGAAPESPPPREGRTKAADYQAAMEKRGRERDWGGAPRSGRRREEENGVRDSGESARVPAKSSRKGSKKGRAMTRELSLDLEKGLGMHLKAFS